ncbi:hypothetical protein G9P44_002573 [Scheffersomyces stipitis]|nr:hypothetical protein G9P44_002573 [Scheffersomyces stipitis]
MMTSPHANPNGIETKIIAARSEAQALYNELEKVKNRLHDSTLDEISYSIPGIPKNFNNLKLYNTLRGHNNKIAKTQWSSDSSKLLSASQDGYMILWDAVTGFKKQAINLENQWVLTCSYSSDGKLAASAGLDNACTIYKVKQDGDFRFGGTRGEARKGSATGNDLDISPVQSVFKGHTAYVSDCGFITNTTIITASGDMTCSLWDITKGVKSRDFVEHLGDVLCMSIFPSNKLNDNLFVSGSSDGSAKIWDLRSPTPASSFFVSNSDINTVSIFPNGNSFATGSDDGLIRLFDIRADCELSNYSLLSQFQKQNHKIPKAKIPSRRHSTTDQVSTGSISIYSSIDNPGVFSLDFSNSGRLLYACYSEFGCLVWDVLKNEIVGSVGNDHVNKINHISVSPDGTAVATSSWDSTIKIWSV